VRTTRSASRLATVADAFLRPKTAGPRCIAIGGASPGIAPRVVAEALRRAAGALPIVVRLLDEPDGPSDGPPGLWIVDLGRPTLDSVRRLPPPRPGQGPQLLLWCLGAQAPSLQELYVFELWNWSLGALATRCILPGPDTESAQRELTRRQPAAPPLCWPQGPAERHRLALGILQSALSAAGPAVGARSLQAVCEANVGGTGNEAWPDD
jgi:hypothetical protein